VEKLSLDDNYGFLVYAPKKINTFYYEIIIASRKAGSALQKRVPLYKKQKKLKAKKKHFFFVFLTSLIVDDVEFC
jgi:hypothetical protein